MTKRQAARLRAVRWMKGMLVAGSVAASLLGAQLLAENEQQRPLPALVEPAGAGQVELGRAPTSGQRLQLRPVPTAAVRLRPIARSRSSR